MKILSGLGDNYFMIPGQQRSSDGIIKLLHCGCQKGKCNSVLYKNDVNYYTNIFLRILRDNTIIYSQVSIGH